ncbi:MAG: ATP-binding cassette domain-containing protein [Spirochaetaceae bacterium]|nr:ATP-binding cassette domain-containing protein [Spirochaetaceae bacterium]
MQLIRFKVGVARATFTSERWTEAISLIAQLALLVLGVLLIGSGELTVGGFVALVEYFAMTRAVLATINFAGVMSQQRVAGIDRYLRTLELPTEVDGTATVRRVEHGAIRFDEVTFGYAGRNDVLTGLSLDVTAGEKIALVGASGAGKSTIISLLLRFYSPGAGRIALDGSDIASFPLVALRRDVGVVRQEPILFTGTLRSNLCLGIETDPPDEALWAACESAKIDDFVRSLPDRLDTVVGASGRQMSGGQRQRLAIARVLLRDSRILVFDEATSAIDHQAETAIHAALTQASAGRTTIVIAHRQSTIRSSERIAFLAGGRVAAVGAHEELHATCPEYRVHFGAAE